MTLKYMMGTQLCGSRTIFHKPTKEFIDYALKLPELVLELGNKPNVFETKEGAIVNTDGNMAFVKGIFLKEMESLFSYNFKYANVNPDRNDFHKFDEKEAITNILSQIEDKEIIKTFFEKLLVYYESNKEDENRWFFDETLPKDMQVRDDLTRRMMFNINTEEEREKRLELWKSAFYSAYCSVNNIKEEAGKEIILETDYKIPDYMLETLQKYMIVDVPKRWRRILKEMGIKTDKEIIPEYIEEIVPTSLTLDYGSQTWDRQRIVLDSCQNHLPSDCGGTQIFLRFQDSWGNWHDYREFGKYTDKEIKKIKISDNGIGYDYKNLGLLASVKQDNSSGKWGEGLKMLTLAALRNGEKISFHSRDWLATPEIQQEILNEGKINETKKDRLIFRVKKIVDPNSKEIDDRDNPQNRDYGYLKREESSSTTFEDPSPELIKLFRNIRDGILIFSPRTPVASTEKADILETSGGRLFIRQILIPGKHGLKYTYHLKDFDIENRDRNMIKTESIKKEIKQLLENVKDSDFISQFLSDAKSYIGDYNEESLLEFDTNFQIQPNTPLADIWIEAFKKKYGERTSIRSVTDMDFNAYHQAQHLGIEMVTLPRNLANALIGLKGQNGQYIISYKQALHDALQNTIPVAVEDLTEKEKQTLDNLYKYNKILKLSGEHKNEITEIKVYDYPEDYKGDKAAGYAQFGNTMHIYREILNSDMVNAGDIFFHEATHAETGAADAQSAFRDQLTRTLSGLARMLMPLIESIEDNGISDDISSSDIKKALEDWTQVLNKDENAKEGNGDRYE